MITRMRNYFLTAMSTNLIFIFSIMFWLGRHRNEDRHVALILLAIAAATFLILAIVEIILTIKSKDGKLTKIFFLLAGISAVGFPVCAVLHNVIYGLFFHGKQGDEAVFFILALFVCPILFIIGTIGSTVCVMRKVKPLINTN